MGWGANVDTVARVWTQQTTGTFVQHLDVTTTIVVSPLSGAMAQTSTKTVKSFALGARSIRGNLVLLARAFLLTSII